MILVRRRACADVRLRPSILAVERIRAVRPATIEVEGTINHGNTSKVSGSCNTAADVIELKGISNVTIIGVGLAWAGLAAPPCCASAPTTAPAKVATTTAVTNHRIPDTPQSQATTHTRVAIPRGPIVQSRHPARQRSLL